MGAQKTKKQRSLQKKARAAWSEGGRENTRKREQESHQNKSLKSGNMKYGACLKPQNCVRELREAQ